MPLGASAILRWAATGKTQAVSTPAGHPDFAVTRVQWIEIMVKEEITVKEAKRRMETTG